MNRLSRLVGQSKTGYFISLIQTPALDADSFYSVTKKKDNLFNEKL